ncbi:MAG: L,D-transpeptidase family protein, partial [Candidatus Deferrimicrobiaceae bacterium]
AGILACSPTQTPVGKPFLESSVDLLRGKIEAGMATAKFTCRQELLCGSSVIPMFYARREYAPAWMGPDGRFSQADSLIAAIRESSRDGLLPDDYHLARIESLLAEARQQRGKGKPYDPDTATDLDLLLTDAFLLYGSHLLAGRVDPETLHADWVAYNPTTDLGALLESALDANTVEHSLKGLRPPYPGYVGLQNTLMRYRNLAEQGGWPVIPPGDCMEKGERGERVGLLRKRLAISGELDLPEPDDAMVFDDALESAVRSFQRNHGLEPDGIVGQETLSALAVPVQDRVRQIVLNMERWRWVPRDLGRRYLLMNIPEYTLRLFEDSGVAMEMRIVAGKSYTATPVFSGTMKYLELNPYWNIPHQIAVEEILPKLRTDPGYLAKRGIRVFSSWRNDASEIDPATVDWNNLDDRGFFFKLRQDPGPRNPLGRVKFMFPNRFAVYLHDTPSAELFRISSRDFSHGCIRLEKAIGLAAYLLRNNPRWTRQKIEEAIARGEKVIIPLDEPIPVHILYWTAWVDDKGTVHFHEDVYERDNPLAMALKEPPPAVRGL